MLAAIVREAGRRFGDRVAFAAPDGATLTYAALDHHADTWAQALRRQGVGEGDVVALTLPSGFAYVIAYVASQRLGAITTGVNPRLTLVEQQAVLEVARPRLVLDEQAVARLPADGEPGGGSSASLDLGPDPERLVAIVFTSGTTGVPKGAFFGERELEAIARSDVPGWDDDTTWGLGGHLLASTQFAHIGFMTKLPWYLRLGTTTHLLDRWRAPDVLKLVSTHRMTSIGGVAPQLALLLHDPHFDDYDLSSVSTIVMGGALSPPALVREARERIGAAYSIRYSSTESGGVGTGTAFDAPDEEALFTVGRPRGDVQLEIRDEHDRPVAQGAVGEVCLRSSCMMRGYWRDPIATAETLAGGWLHTGDLGFLDEAGCLRLAGRRKEMFVRGGYNVYPLEVEAVLASHPDVAEIAIVPRPHPVLGEIGVAVVVPRPGASPPALDELRRFGSERLAAYKLPEDVVVTDALPRTAMQKIDRRALVATVAGGA